jgi:hypothetical protein
MTLTIISSTWRWKLEGPTPDELESDSAVRVHPRPQPREARTHFDLLIGLRGSFQSLIIHGSQEINVLTLV